MRQRSSASYTLKDRDTLINEDANPSSIARYLAYYFNLASLLQRHGYENNIPPQRVCIPQL